MGLFLDQDGLSTLWNKIKSVFAKKSDLDGKADVGDLGEQIIALEDNGTTTAGVWLAKSDKVTEYVDGALYMYKITKAGASTTTLNINGLGAKTVHYQPGAKLTTHFPVGVWILLFYRGGSDVFVAINNYNSDSNSVPGVYCSTTATAAAKVGALTTHYAQVKAAIDGGPMYLTVCMYYTNTKAAALTLNVDGSGAKPIYINGEPSSATNHTLPAGMYFVYWDGEHYHFRTDGKLTINGVVFGGSYNDLADKPTIPAVPSNVSAFTNDAGYLVAGDIENKVDKVSGKGLSTNDYTTAEKNKLAGIASGATANAGTITGVSLNGTSVATSGVANLKNIPTKIIINSGQKAIDQNGIVDLGTYLTVQSLTHLAPIASPEFTGTPTAPTPTSASGATQIATKGYVDTAVAGASGGGSGSGKVYLGKCLTAAGTAAKVGTIDGTFTLEVGCIVGLFSTITNTASNPTLNVANTGAYPIWYANEKLTTSYKARAQQANCTTFFVFTGEYWHFLSQGADFNTQYSEITIANLNSSTSSTAGLITGRRLQSALGTWKTNQGLATESYVDTAIANAGTVTGVSQADLNTQLPPVGVAGTVKCIYKNTGNAAASIEILPQNSAAAVEYLSVDGEQVPRALLDAGVMSRTLNPNETIEVEFVFAPVAGLMPWRNSVVPQGVIGNGNIIQTLVLPASVVVVEDRQGFDQLADVWCLGPQPPAFGDLADIRANVHAPRIFASMYTSEYVTNGGYPVTIMSY